MTPDGSLCEVRAPWPDELPRLASAFPGAPWHQPLLLRVMVAKRPHERIVGLGALTMQTPAPDSTTLFIAIRARFAAHAATDEMIAEILASARNSRIRSVSLSLDGATEAVTASLIRAGFVCDARGCHWSTG